MRIPYKENEDDGSAEKGYKLLKQAKKAYPDTHGIAIFSDNDLTIIGEDEFVKEHIENNMGLRDDPKNSEYVNLALNFYDLINQKDTPFNDAVAALELARLWT